MLSAGQTIGQYRLNAQLGAGGSATVWAARSDQTDVDVALKVLHPELVDRGPSHGPSPAARFIAEAQLLRRLEHPGMVRVLDIVDERAHGFIAFAMERLHGKNLLDLSKADRIDLPSLLEALASTARTLGHMHEHGVVHRDVKQSNIFICTRRSEPDASMTKLLDFGIAKQVDDESDLEATHLGHVVGTSHTLTPEVIDRAEGKQNVLTGAVDQWGLGVVLYKTLTGRFPFRADSTAQLIAQIRRWPPPVMALKNRFGFDQAPGVLDNIIRRSLAKDPDARFPNAHQMAFALLDAREELFGDVVAPVDEATTQMYWAGPAGPLELELLAAHQARPTAPSTSTGRPPSTALEATAVDGFAEEVNHADERTALDQRAIERVHSSYVSDQPTALDQRAISRTSPDLPDPSLESTALDGAARPDTVRGRSEDAMLSEDGMPSALVAALADGSGFADIPLVNADGEERTFLDMAPADYAPAEDAEDALAESTAPRKAQPPGALNSPEAAKAPEAPEAPRDHRPAVITAPMVPPAPHPPAVDGPAPSAVGPPRHDTTPSAHAPDWARSALAETTDPPFDPTPIQPPPPTAPLETADTRLLRQFDLREAEEAPQSDLAIIVKFLVGAAVLLLGFVVGWFLL